MGSCKSKQARIAIGGGAVLAFEAKKSFWCSSRFLTESCDYVNLGVKMGVWERLRFQHLTTGAWEAGTKKNGGMRNRPGQRRWSFEDPKNRKLGKHFFQTLKSLPESPTKAQITSIIFSYQEFGGLTSKQWGLLGLLMNKADPACPDNPEIKVKTKKNEFRPGKPVLRKKQDTLPSERKESRLQPGISGPEEKRMASRCAKATPKSTPRKLRAER
jgi:hypothetical protein